MVEADLDAILDRIIWLAAPRRSIQPFSLDACPREQD